MTEHATAPQPEIPKAYDPASIEHKWYPFWEDSGYFQPQGDGEPYSIVIPPPNVTGYLHMGHALQHAIMDTLTRWRRMQGRRALWLPGTDHAGIATQMVVEKQLAEQGISRTDLGREAFERKVWEWKEHSGGTIQKQMRLEGISVDWTRERFTLDTGLSEAVREVFVRLYEQGLIYRGAYMVNWSPKLQTAVSDLEVEMKEVKGKLYHITYKIAGSDETVTVATTRPETMLGDTALAVNPDDERYAHLHGKTAILPIVGREIPIIADGILVQMGFGTGVVKVTPAHDLNDFETGKRHNLDSVIVIGKDGRMTTEAGEGFAGLDRFKAREKVVQTLEELGALAKVEDYTHNVGHCQRSGVPIEPLVSDQWFLDVKDMAAKSIAAVKDGRTRFVPSSWEKVYFDWMENIRPWCISRQLWWGHRIPAWHTADGRFAVARDEAAARAQLGIGGDAELTQDADVLDTWFSSALWAFSTFNWTGDAEKDAANEDLKLYTPTSVLVTGFDIIFFWVARMMMMSLHFTDDVPFRTVFITGLVRDAQGQKMSKTKGNVIDPLEVFNKYGTDAVRYSLLSAVTGGNDIKLQETKMESARNFANKIWNATRFVLMNLGDGTTGQSDAPAQLQDRWILSRLNRVAGEVNEAFENYRFHDAALGLYKFFWNDFCDWYIELAKPLVTAPDATPEVIAARTRIADILEQSMRLLHPLMPFITEELWQRVKEVQGPKSKVQSSESVCIAEFPKGNAALIDETAEAEMETVIGVITRARNIRSEMNIPNATALDLHIAATGRDAEVLREQEASIRRLARIENVVFHETLPDLGFSAKALVGDARLAIPLEGIIDRDKERARLEKEIAKREKDLNVVSTVLNRPGFAENAAPEIVAEKQEQLATLETQLAALRETLAAL